jgi:anti-sigma regulatory factor (Ser/Thr protein kinase)
LAGRRHPSDIQDSRLLAVLSKYVPPIIARSIVERARREAASGPDVSWADPNGLLDRISVGVRLFAAPERQSEILREISDLALTDVDDSPSPYSAVEELATPPSVLAQSTASRHELLPPPPLPPSTRRATPDAAPVSRGVFSVVGGPRSSPGGTGRAPSPSNPGGIPQPGGAAGPPSTSLQPKPGAPEPREVTITLVTEHDIPRARQVAREICERLGARALTQQRLVTIVSELGRNMVLYAGGGKITLRPPASTPRRLMVLAIDQGSGIPNLPEILAGKYKSRTGLGLGIVGTKRLADTFHIETSRHGTAISVEVIV